MGDFPVLVSYTQQITCEHETSILQCPPDLRLLIIKANYGRTDKKACNLPEYSSYNFENTTCVFNQLEYVNEKCLNKNSCSIEVSNGVFTDPCVNTFKYLGLFSNLIFIFYLNIIFNIFFKF